MAKKKKPETEEEVKERVAYRCKQCHRMFLSNIRCPYCGGEQYQIKTTIYNPEDKTSWGPDIPMLQNWDDDD